MCRFKNSRIRHENKMKILYGKHYPTWRKEAELRIQQLDNWINDPNTKILNLLFFVEEKIELLEALLEEN